MSKAKAGGNAAFYFLNEGYDTSGKRLMGRHAAGEGFLQGWVRHAEVDAVYGFAPQGKQAETFLAKAKAAHRKTDPRVVHFHEPHKLSEPGALFYPGPNLSRLSWSRRRAQQRGYSIVGVTHTTATDRVMEALGAVYTSPMQNWDAIICTSTAVKSMVTTVLDGYGAYLREHFGARRDKPAFELPVIPLGVDADALDPEAPAAQAARKSWREKLGIGDDDVAVLWVGRFTHFAKSNPWPMYVALENAARASGKRFHMIDAGWFANDAIKQAFEEGFAAAAPNVKRHVLDGRESDVRSGVWFAADIFCSLSDNIQETFGLTPIEAMAAGLPVVVSDWDGYRDTVRHGVDGVRAPTLTPPPGGGADLAMLYEIEAESYDAYCFRAACATSVDIPSVAQALAGMAANPDLRKRMGAAGRERARSVYDWSHVVRDYQALMQELSARRQSATEFCVRRGDEPANPLRDDPFRLFATYPTRTLGQDDVIEPVAKTDFVKRVAAAQRLKLFQRAGLLPANLLKPMLDKLATGRRPISELLSALPQGAPRALAVRTMVWLAKTGLVTLGPANAARPAQGAKAAARPDLDKPII